MKSRKKDEIDLFKEWLVARGAEMLVPTSEWEIVRYRGGGTTSIIYTNKGGNRKYTGLAQSAWDAFKARSDTYRADLRIAGQTKTAYRTSIIIRTLIERDGDFCFYCGAPFSEELRRTKEHLIPRTHNGPDHISNMFLSCEPCNLEAGHMSVAEKIRMRDRKRRGRGGKLLAAILANGPALTAELTLEIQSFLHESKPKEKN